MAKDSNIVHQYFKKEIENFILSFNQPFYLHFICILTTRQCKWKVFSASDYKF